MSVPLRYQISNWTQLPGALSNTSRDYHIHVTQFENNDSLTGTRITVDHSKFGVVFSTVVNAKGSCIANLDDTISADMTTEQILTQLAKFGYLITFHNYENLSGDQVSFLMTLKGLHFDKIRVMRVYHPELVGTDLSDTLVVAFNIEQNPAWLQASYSCSQSEFNRALNEGSAFNITAVSKGRNYNWDWLYNFVADISDVLNDNAGTLQYDYTGKETAQWP